MRSVGDSGQFTPFGLWLRSYLPQKGFSITNLDYVIENYVLKKLLLLEEKQRAGRLHHAQKLTFDVLDQALSYAASVLGYDYWGFYVLTFPKEATMPGPGMTLNGRLITNEQLVDHLSFKRRFCDPFPLPWKDDVARKIVQNGRNAASFDSRETLI